jgi:hypothetical protein
MQNSLVLLQLQKSRKHQLNKLRPPNLQSNRRCLRLMPPRGRRNLRLSNPLCLRHAHQKFRMTYIEIFHLSPHHSRPWLRHLPNVDKVYLLLDCHLPHRSQPFIKREPSMPPAPGGAGPSDRRGSIHTTSSTPIHSPVIPGGFQPVHDPRRPPPQILTNFDGPSHQQPSWPQSPVVGTPSFPPGTPLDQKPIDVLLARAGFSSQQKPTRPTK